MKLSLADSHAEKENGMSKVKPLGANVIRLVRKLKILYYFKVYYDILRVYKNPARLMELANKLSISLGNSRGKTDIVRSAFIIFFIFIYNNE